MFLGGGVSANRSMSCLTQHVPSTVELMSDNVWSSQRSVSLFQAIWIATIGRAAGLQSSVFVNKRCQQSSLHLHTITNSKFSKCVTFIRNILPSLGIIHLGHCSECRGPHTVQGQFRKQLDSE